VSREAGASFRGKGVEVSSMDIVAEASGATAVTYTGVKVGVGDGDISCGVDTGLAAGAHPEKMIKTIGRRTRGRFMGCRLGGESAWM
jgi:hypothetical protein